MNLLKRVYHYGQSSINKHTLQGIVSPHIIKIIDQDLLESNHKYGQCYKYMFQVTERYSKNQAKIKCNLLFSANSVCQSLSHLKNILSQLIIHQNIKTQYQLDQLIKWLTKQIKINKDLGMNEITIKLQDNSKDSSFFEKEIMQIEKQLPKCTVSQLCKNFRQKYPNIDSKVIYQRISNIFKCSPIAQNIPKKQNKLWDKLLQIKPRQLKLQCNSKQIYNEHLKITGGKPRFRFPPQPNGYLHIGHVKSIRVNFESALRTGGSCYLRYDDTNPDKQSHEFIKEIQENVRWLGYTPDKITFASDYFQQLEIFALQLIKSGYAYVCDSSQEQIELQRKNKSANVWRERKISQNLKIFPNLASNQTLRLKATYDSPNPTLRDPILYRLKQKPHPKTGRRFKIYPMYDFTHGICDSLQHIDYSFCSLQFEVRRQLYYTFLDLLGLFKPVVWQYSRLNIEGNVLSKRKIKDFIDREVVDGWDDPRLLTICGLRNRGYTPEMLKQFIDKVNCSRSSNENIIQSSLLQKQMKKQLLANAYKTMGVLQPFSVNVIDSQNISNYCIQSTIYIQQLDAAKLLNNEIIILKNAGAFIYSKVNGSLTLTKFESQNIPALKKAYPNIKILHWTNQSQTIPIKTVIYSKLLNSEGQVNPNSKIQYNNARIPKNLLQSGSEYIQLQKIGFFKFTNNKKQLHLCTLL